MTDFLMDVIATELEDAVGKENCSTRTIDKLTHSVDFFWLSRMWVDRGLRMPEGDFIVAPKDAKEVSAVLPSTEPLATTRYSVAPSTASQLASPPTKVKVNSSFSAGALLSSFEELSELSVALSVAEHPTSINPASKAYNHFSLFI